MCLLSFQFGTKIKFVIHLLDKSRLMKLSTLTLFTFLFTFHSGPENLKKSRPKKLVKSRKSILRNVFMTKIHFLQFQNWPNITFWTGEKVYNCQIYNFTKKNCEYFPRLTLNFSWNWFIWFFHEFFAWTFWNFPLCFSQFLLSLFTFFCLLLQYHWWWSQRICWRITWTEEKIWWIDSWTNKNICRKFQKFWRNIKRFSHFFLPSTYHIFTIRTRSLIIWHFF